MCVTTNAARWPMKNSPVSLPALTLKPIHDLLGQDISAKQDWQGPAEALLNLQGKPAHECWTHAEWTKLCYHLHNENGPNRFGMAFEQQSGEKVYRRSKKRLFSVVIS